MAAPESKSRTVWFGIQCDSLPNLEEETPTKNCLRSSRVTSTIINRSHRYVQRNITKILVGAAVKIKEKQYLDGLDNNKLNLAKLSQYYF